MPGSRARLLHLLIASRLARDAARGFKADVTGDFGTETRAERAIALRAETRGAFTWCTALPSGAELSKW